MNPMSLQGKLAERREEIVAAWIEEVLRGYPQATARFLRSERDPFRNPAGWLLREKLPALFDSLREGSRGGIRTALREIIRLRAVQDFTPDRVVGFLADLKPVLRKALLDAEALTVLDGRIDEAERIAFDLLRECRERIRRIQAGERKRRFFVLERIEATR
jgi:hypothetical protein